MLSHIPNKPGNIYNGLCVPQSLRMQCIRNAEHSWIKLPTLFCLDCLAHMVAEIQKEDANT